MCFLYWTGYIWNTFTIGDAKILTSAASVTLVKLSLKKDTESFDTMYATEKNIY